MKMRIMVATDGQPAAEGALRLARLLAERHGASVDVVAVAERIPMHGLVAAETFALAQRNLEEAGAMALRSRVEEQLASLWPASAGWPVTVAVGSPAPTIVRLAMQKESTLLLVGLGRHALGDRWFGTETALRVVRLSHVPVLAVPADAEELPASAVVAMDFSEFSHDAAEIALQVVRPGGTLHLAHVFWKPSAETFWVGGQDWIEAHREADRLRLEDYAQRLENSADVHVPTHYMEGNAARELLRLAERVQADLLVAGSHGTGFVGRVVMGSVSTRLLRGSVCAVLVAPPRTIAEVLDEEAASSEELALSR
jgi:nucleotide-binding universal stress UspA family protein